MKNYIIGGLIGLIIVVGGYLIFGSLSSSPGNQSVESEFAFIESEFDFGVIKQSGGLVSHKFEFTYTGEVERNITAVVGSCGCTTGEIDVEVLRQGTKGAVTVVFDPNLHEEPEGRFYKTVSVLTDPLMEEEIEVKIWVEIDLDLGPEAFTLQSGEFDDDEEHEDEHNSQTYGEIHADELVSRLEDKDFFLLDVHIPEQEHIDGTDEFIDFTQITQNLDKLPENKDEEIIIYCRSGSMSQVAAKDLIENGYTNVKYLEGGIREFNEEINK